MDVERESRGRFSMDQIVGDFTLLALFISALGLFGPAFLTFP